MNRIFFTLFFAAASLSALEPWQNLDDFENGKKAWSVWADGSSRKPEFAIAEEGGQTGNHVARIRFPDTPGQAIAGKHGIHIPKHENALKLRLQSSTGAMPSLLLEEALGGAGAGDAFRYTVPAAEPGKWVELTIPLSQFTYAFTKGKEGNKTFDKNAMFSLNISFHKQPGEITLLLNDLSWVHVKE